MAATEVTRVRARKEHWCWWCGEAIPAGETYCKWTWFDEGTPRTVKAHVECAEAWATLPRNDADDVDAASYSRGCTCEHGRCECGIAKAALAKAKAKKKEKGDE